MAPAPNPRRGAESRQELARSPKPNTDTTALAELREALAGLAQRIVDPREEVKALSEGLARQSAMLEQLATLQTKAATLQRDTGRQLAQLRSSLAASPPAGLWRRLVEFAKLRLQPTAAAPAAAVSEAPPVRRLNWILADAAQGGERRAVMIVVFGLSPEERRTVVTRLGERPAAAGIVPIYVTDSTDFEPFRSAHAFFEHLPLRRGGRTAQSRDPGLYATRRFELLCDKWKPIRVVGFGPTAVAWLAAEARGPLLPPDIKTLLATVDTDVPGVPALGQA